MSDIKFYCPSCSAKLAINKNATGKKIDCPECKTPIQVPTRSTRGGADTDIIRLPPDDIETTLEEFSDQINSEIEEIRDAVGKLQRHLTSGKSEKVSRSEFDNCLKTVMQLKRSETTYSDELKTFQKDVKALQKALEKLNNLNLSSHEKQIAKADDKLKDVNEKIQPLAKGLTKIEKLEEAVKTLTQDISNLQKTDVSAPVDKLKEELKASKASLKEDTKKTGVLEKQQEAFQKQLDELKTQLENVARTEDTTSLQKTISNIEKQQQSLEKKLSKHEPADLQKAITAIENKLSKDTSADLKSDMATQRKGLTQAEKTLEAQGKNIAGLEKGLKDLEKQLKLKDTHIEKLDASAKSLTEQLKANEKLMSSQQKALDEMVKETQKMWGIIDARFGDLDANGPGIGERLGILEDNAHRMKEFAAGFGTKTADAIKTLQHRIEEIMNPEVPEGGSGRKGAPPKLPENFDELVFQQSSTERKIHQLEALVKMTSSRVQIIENARRGTMDDEDEE